MTAPSPVIVGVQRDRLLSGATGLRRAISLVEIGALVVRVAYVLASYGRRRQRWRATAPWTAERLENRGCRVVYGWSHCCAMRRAISASSSVMSLPATSKATWWIVPVNANGGS